MYKMTLPLSSSLLHRCWEFSLFFIPRDRRCSHETVKKQRLLIMEKIVCGGFSQTPQFYDADSCLEVPEVSVALQVGCV